uniref:Uncharacterized protein AlNc14C1G39 n=1 Tax=Albugo laibachii Nc14 TaxID=890382 RepID=F0VYN7_9STRA|nr:hypothetical protein PITG_01879 [Albugo laibachii Nc14]|eukprot:CCA13901.1 hypothetical protein PITG_01879 [Albugo laibachii Nc14]
MSVCIEIRAHSFALALQQVIVNLTALQDPKTEDAIIIIVISDIELSIDIQESQYPSFWEQFIRTKLDSNPQSRKQIHLHFGMANLKTAEYNKNEIHIIYQVANSRETQLIASSAVEALPRDLVTIFVIQHRIEFDSGFRFPQSIFPAETLIYGMKMLKSFVRVSRLFPSYSLDRIWYRVFQPLDGFNMDCRGQIAYEIYSTCTVKASLPLSLLILLASWTHCHPIVMRDVEPVIRKKARYLHQRYRESIQQLLGSCELSPSRSFLTPSKSHRPKCLRDDPMHVRLSKCRLWDRQRQFYREQGMQAWSKHHIPFGISSSSLIAQQYARLAIDFLTYVASKRPPTETLKASSKPNCYIFEAASGSCKFLSSFLHHFYKLVDEMQLGDRFGLIPCVIASDLSEQVITSSLNMECFQKYLVSDQLDFVIMDTDAMMQEDTKRLFRMYQQQFWSYDTLDPVFIIGNYFLDSLPSDAWLLQHEIESEGAECTLYEVCVSNDANSAKDVKCTFRAFHGDAYKHPLIQRAFCNVVRRAVASKPIHSTSLVVFPIHSLEFLIRLLGIGTQSQAPRGFVFGDAGYSFRDPFRLSQDMELPQLSPTPECFCLAVDFEVLQAFFQEIRNISAWIRIDENVANDTFDLCTGAVYVDEPDLVRVYTTLQSSMSPCELDHLYELVSSDKLNGILYDLTLEMLLALLIHSGFDYELFLLVQWKLYRKWKLQEDEQMRRSTYKIGRKCHQMRYQMDPAAERSLTRQNVQMNRWLNRK